MTLFLASYLFTIAVFSISKYTSGSNCPSTRRLISRISPLPRPQETLSALFGSNPKSKAVLVDLLSHFNNVGSQKDSGLYECQRTPKAQRLYLNAAAQAKHMGLGTLNVGTLHDCLISIEDDETSRTGFKAIFELIKSFSNMVEYFSATSLPAYGLFWKNSFTPDIFSYVARGNIKCEMVMSLGYRVNNSWGVAAILTNYSTERIIPGTKRGYFTEVISLDSSNNSKPIEVSIPACPNGKFSFFKTTPALLETWGGKPSWSHFALRSLPENPALRNSLRLLDEMKIAEELVTSSGKRV